MVPFTLTGAPIHAPAGGLVGKCRGFT